MAESRSAELGGAKQTITQDFAHEPLIDLPVLIVEDEPFVGLVLHALLTDHGYRPIGPAQTLAAAKEAIAENALAAGLLDIRLDGDDRSFELAEILAALRIPFAFLSSYSAALIPRKFRGVPLLTKPYASGDVLALLTQLLANLSGPDRGASATCNRSTQPPVPTVPHCLGEHRPTAGVSPLPQNGRSSVACNSRCR